MFPSIIVELLFDRNTGVWFVGQTPLIICNDGKFAYTREDAYPGKDEDYNLDQQTIPQRLTEILQRDGWPQPYTRVSS